MTSLAAAHLAACTVDDDALSTTNTEQAITSRGDTMVPPTIARAVAETFTNQEGRLAKHVRDVTTLADASGRTALYGVNFVEDGYAIISGELDLLPIVAFSDEGSIDFTRLQKGEDGLVGEFRAAIEAMRTTAPGVDARLDELRTERIQWQPYLDAIATRADVPRADLDAARAGTTDFCYPGPCSPPPVTYCTSTKTVVYDKLLSTWWDQGCNFNSEVDPSPTGPCQHKLVGCSAVAAGQLMRYHRRGFNNAYNWDLMANGAGGTPQQISVRNWFLGTVAYGVKTNFGDTISTAYDTDTMALLNSNGYYAYRSWVPYGIANTGLTEIKGHRPMIMEGDNAAGVGHMWVVDGAKEVIGTAPEGCKLKPGSNHAYFHHNLGHGSSGPWYADLNFGTYHYDRYLIPVKPL